MPGKIHDLLFLLTMCILYFGINVSLPNDKVINCKVYLLSGLFDLPAKCLFLEEVQFNGFYECSYCMEPGKSTKVSDEGRGQVHVHPYNEQSITGHAELRTHESVILNGLESLQASDGKPVSAYFLNLFKK